MILAICRDTGGTNGILPVIRELRHLKHDVVTFAHGLAPKILTSQNEPFTLVDSPAEILEKNISNIEAFISSSCSNIGAETISALRDRCPTVVVQDFWGGEMLKTWSTPDHIPDWTLVNDRVGVEILVKNWAGFRPEQAVITGFPALDKYSLVDILDEKDKLRSKLALKENWPLIFFAGQFKYTTEILIEVVEVLNSLGKNFYILAGYHPNLPKEWPEGFKLWQETVAKLDPLNNIARPADVTTPQIIAGSDIVISLFSTVLIEATVLRKFGIAGLYAPGADPEKFKKDTYLDLDSLPLVDLGCTGGASSREELESLLEQGLNGENPFRENQEKHFRLDGKNAERAARTISDIVSGT